MQYLRMLAKYRTLTVRLVSRHLILVSQMTGYRWEESRSFRQLTAWVFLCIVNVLHLEVFTGDSVLGGHFDWQVCQPCCNVQWPRLAISSDLQSRTKCCRCYASLGVLCTQVDRPDRYPLTSGGVEKVATAMRRLADIINRCPTHH